MRLINSKKVKIFVLTAMMTVLFATCSFAARVTANVNANIHKGSKTSSEVVTVIKKGTTRTILRTKSLSTGTWYKLKVNGNVGYVKAKYVSPANEGSNATDNSTVNTNNSNSGNSNATSLGEKLVATAKKYLGCRYVYGAAGPTTFDCSGLTSYVYKAHGKSIPRTSRDQYKSSIKVSKSNLQKGDLVFFDCNGANDGVVSHVGMYIGDGQFIHAANSRDGVIISKLSERYYVNAYVGSGRY